MNIDPIHECCILLDFKNAVKDVVSYLSQKHTSIAYLGGKEIIHDQVSHDFSFRDFFLQNEMREKQDKHIGGSINDRTIAHIYFCITPCIEEEDQHIYGV